MGEEKREERKRRKRKQDRIFDVKKALFEGGSYNPWCALILAVFKQAKKDSKKRNKEGREARRFIERWRRIYFVLKKRLSQR